MLNLMRQHICGYPRILGAQSGSRAITYLHSGSRIRGLKRDPSEYLKLPNGLSYGEVAPQNYQERVRASLNLQDYDITLPNELILQCFTHKSFAHGSKPYNEKLSALGSQFLKYHASVHTVKGGEPAAVKEGIQEQHTINGLNFAKLGSLESKKLIDKHTTAQLVRSRQLDTLIFWKKRDPLKNENFNGENSVYSSVLNALLGGILITNGPEKTSHYIDSELLNPSKKASLASIANSAV